MPATRKSVTGKGYHLWFRWDGSSPVRNAQRTAKGWPFPALPGAEVRGEGGYVILPPSQHPSGRLYQWERDVPASDAPRTLLELVCARVPGNNDLATGGIVPQPGLLATAVRGSEDTPYGLAALRAECDIINSAPPGAQEKTLNDGALKIGGLVGAGCLAFDTASKQLVAAGLTLTSHNPGRPLDAAAHSHES